MGNGFKTKRLCTCMITCECMSRFCTFSYLKLINIHILALYAGIKWYLKWTKQNQNTKNIIKYAAEAIIVLFALAFKHISNSSAYRCKYVVYITVKNLSNRFNVDRRRYECNDNTHRKRNNEQTNERTNEKEKKN